jgi:hypothetical protein
MEDCAVSATPYLKVEEPPKCIARRLQVVPRSLKRREKRTGGRMKRDLLRIVLIVGATAACRESREIPKRVGSEGPQIDPKAVALLQGAERRISATPAFEVDATSETYMPDGRISSRARYAVKFVHPKQMRIETRGSWRTKGDTLSSESHEIETIDSAWTLSWSGSSPKAPRSMRTARVPYLGVHTFVAAWDSTAELIYAREWNSKRVNDENLISLRYLGQREWKGGAYHVVQWVWREKWLAPEDAYVDTTYFYIAPDQTIRRIRTHTSKGSVVDEQVSKLVLDAKLTAADVAYDGPVKPKLTDAIAASPEGKFAAAMVGKSAPEFVIPTAQGDTLRLKAQLAKQRATIIFTWFYG